MTTQPISPVFGGGLAHLWRMIQSNSGDPGNQEVICQAGPDKLY